jgi:hypothetical protein
MPFGVVPLEATEDDVVVLAPLGPLDVVVLGDAVALLRPTGFDPTEGWEPPARRPIAAMTPPATSPAIPITPAAEAFCRKTRRSNSAAR